MKKLLLITALAVGAANAKIIPTLVSMPDGPCPITGGQTVCTFEYSATVHTGAMVTANSGHFFTIYDFFGYIENSATTPEGWSVHVANSGLTPSSIAIGNRDIPEVSNLTFRYQTGSAMMSGETVIGFSARSNFGPSSTFGWYTSQAAKQGDAPGTVTQNIGRIQVPQQQPAGEPGGEVPEPMSMALLGGGIVALGLLPRQHRK